MEENNVIKTTRMVNLDEESFLYYFGYAVKNILREKVTREGNSL